MNNQKVYVSSALDGGCLPMLHFTGIKMTKRKYKDGGPIPYPSGPTNGIGGYEKWNWCSRCCDIHSKDIRHCSNCGCMLRTTSKYKYGAKALNTR